jgi:hypothetical protein
MSIKKKMPELEHVAILDSDSKQYPAVDSAGYYTSMDIVKIFDEIKMDALQEWFRRKLIRPKHCTERKPGWIKYFNRSGLCMIAIFKRLVDLGIPRKRARSDMLRVHQARVDHINQFDREPDFISLEIENKIVMRITTSTGRIELRKDMKDVVIINLYKILFKIDSYKKSKAGPLLTLPQNYDMRRAICHKQQQSCFGFHRMNRVRNYRLNPRIDLR